MFKPRNIPLEEIKTKDDPVVYPLPTTEGGRIFTSPINSKEQYDEATLDALDQPKQVTLLENSTKPTPGPDDLTITNPPPVLMNGLFLTQLEVWTLWKKCKLILWGAATPTILFYFITDTSKLETSTNNSANLNNYMAMNSTLAAISEVPQGALTIKTSWNS